MSAVGKLSLKEIALLTCVVIVMWVCSFTVLFPTLCLLKLSSRLRNRLRKCICNNCFDEEHNYLLRENLFSLLQQNCPQYNCRRLQVLELGFWNKHDLDCYPDQHNVLASDNDDGFLLKIKSEEAKSVVFCRDPSLLKCYEANAYDVVVSTFYLCTVKNVGETLKDILRILKPGGKFAFLEHVGYPENHAAYALQRMMTPFWKIVFNGCHLNRHLSAYLQKSSYSTINYKTLYTDNRAIFYRPVVIGVCTK